MMSGEPAITPTELVFEGVEFPFGGGALDVGSPDQRLDTSPLIITMVNTAEMVFLNNAVDCLELLMLLDD